MSKRYSLSLPQRTKRCRRCACTGGVQAVDGPHLSCGVPSGSAPCCNSGRRDAGDAPAPMECSRQRPGRTSAVTCRSVSARQRGGLGRAAADAHLEAPRLQKAEQDRLLRNLPTAENRCDTAHAPESGQTCYPRPHRIPVRTGSSVPRRPLTRGNRARAGSAERNRALEPRPWPSTIHNCATLTTITIITKRDIAIFHQRVFANGCGCNTQDISERSEFSAPLPVFAAKLSQRTSDTDRISV